MTAHIIHLILDFRRVARSMTACSLRICFSRAWESFFQEFITSPGSQLPGQTGVSR